ncbi:Beta-1,4-mannosyl-glycoprotein 4-beta-N-acetylglucosaminyltransferase [Halocaridina rubra]|uniref:Beta-1,4-mannosyl-glycoprotein 4-beta-N-acetylglucosaminyltransferase n=1 Tax=Halocaridina rubra TaxID=373956 RepID=A0AAN8WXJ2_HALRR
MSPSNSSHSKEVVTERQKRIGHYIVLFTTSTPGINPASDKDGTNRKKHSHVKKGNFGGLSEAQNHFAYTTQISVSNKIQTFSKKSSNGISTVNNNMNSSVGGFVAISDDVISKKYNNYKEEEEDPILGRGFAEEYVTHRSDGVGILLIDEKQYNLTSSPSSVSSQNFHKATGGLLNIKQDDKKTTVIHYHSKQQRTVQYKAKLNQPSNTTNSISPSTKNSSTDSKAQSNKFQNYDVDNLPEYTLKDDVTTYFVKIGKNRTCFVGGTNIGKTEKTKGMKCVCAAYYYGDDCGIPEAAWFGKYVNIYPHTHLKRRSVPRRVINGLPVNHEFAMFEARMHELYDIVDVFLIAESNYTTYGDSKNLEFLEKFQDGYLQNFQDKLVYIKLDFIANESKSDGWIADAYLRYYMGFKGLPLLKGLRDDDLFILSDADELPTKEILTFLKLYDGYPEPIGFGLKWNVFNFQWQVPPDSTLMNWLRGTKEKMSIVYSAATVGLVQKVLFKNVFFIRKEKAWEYKQVADKLKKYREEGNLVNDWVAGTIGHYAGWHCSWCFSPENIVRKMNSAQANDKPRWGDFPEKKNLTYITSRILDGIWFDDTSKFIRLRNADDRFYAPPYIMKYPKKYRSLLFHPNHPMNKNQEWQPP